MSSFDLTADSGTDHTITNGQTLNIAGTGGRVEAAYEEGTDTTQI